MAHYGNNLFQPIISDSYSSINRISSDDLARVIIDILSTSDLSQTTLKTIRFQILHRLCNLNVNSIGSQVELYYMIRDLIDLVPEVNRRAIDNYYYRYTLALDSGLETFEIGFQLIKSFEKLLKIFTNKSLPIVYGLNVSSSDPNSTASSSTQSDSSSSHIASCNFGLGFDNCFSIFRQTESVFCIPNTCCDYYDFDSDESFNSKSPVDYEPKKQKKQNKSPKKSGRSLFSRLDVSDNPKSKTTSKRATRNTENLFTVPKRISTTHKVSANKAPNNRTNTRRSRRIAATSTPPPVSNSLSTPIIDTAQTPSTESISPIAESFTSPPIRTENETDISNSIPKLDSKPVTPDIESPERVPPQVNEPTEVCTPEPQISAPEFNLPSSPVSCKVTNKHRPEPILTEQEESSVCDVNKSPKETLESSSPNIKAQISDASSLNNVYSRLKQLYALTNDGLGNNKNNIIFWKKLLRDSAYRYFDFGDNQLSTPANETSNDDLKEKTIDIQTDPKPETVIDETILSPASPTPESQYPADPFTSFLDNHPSILSSSKPKLQIIDLAVNYSSESLAYQAQNANQTNLTENKVAESKKKSRSRSRVVKCSCGDAEIASIRSLNSVDSDCKSSISSVHSYRAHSSTIHSYNEDIVSSVPTIGQDITYLTSESDLDKVSNCLKKIALNGKNQTNSSSESSPNQKGANGRPIDETSSSLYSSHVSMPLSDSSEVVHSVESTPEIEKKKNNTQDLAFSDSDAISLSRSESECLNDMEKKKAEKGCDKVPPVKECISKNEVEVPKKQLPSGQTVQKVDSKNVKNKPKSVLEENLQKSENKEHTTITTITSKNDKPADSIKNENVFKNKDMPNNSANKTRQTNKAANKNDLNVPPSKVSSTKRTKVGDNCSNSNKDSNLGGMLKESSQISRDDNVPRIGVDVTNKPQVTSQMSMKEIIQNDEELARRLQQEEYMATRPARRRMAMIAYDRLHEQLSGLKKDPVFDGMQKSTKKRTKTNVTNESDEEVENDQTTGRRNKRRKSTDAGILDSGRKSAFNRKENRSKNKPIASEDNSQLIQMRQIRKRQDKETYKKYTSVQNYERITKFFETDLHSPKKLCTRLLRYAVNRDLIHTKNSSYYIRCNDDLSSLFGMSGSVKFFSLTRMVYKMASKVSQDET